MTDLVICNKHIGSERTDGKKNRYFDAENMIEIQVSLHEKHGYEWESSTVLPYKVTYYENGHFVTENILCHFEFIFQENCFFMPRHYHSYVSAKNCFSLHSKDKEYYFVFVKI